MIPTLLTLLALAAAPAAEAEAPRRTDVCLRDSRGGWAIHKHLAEVMPDGQIRFLGNQQVIPPAELKGGVGQDWFDVGGPITVQGRTYRKVGEVREETWPIGRYNRSMPPYRGVPTMEPLGGEDRRLLVLADPVKCRFQPYEVEPPASPAR